MSAKQKKWSILAVSLTILLGGCAAEMQRRDGMALINEGRVEEGLAALAKASEATPDNAEYRKDYLKQRDLITGQLLRAADRTRQAGELDKAEDGYRRVLALDPQNARAQVGLDAVILARRHLETVAEAEEASRLGDMDKASELLRNVLIDNPDQVAALKLKREISEQQSRGTLGEIQLRQAYTRPINIEFRDANVKMVFESLSRTTGINFILDKDVRPDLRTTVYLRNASIDNALDLIAQTSQLQRKVLNSNTVLIYPNTPDKLKEYQDLVVRGFYLKNADAKTVQNNLKSLFKGREMVIDEKLNLIVMRDTPEAVRLVERIIAMYDIAEPEVMLELEVLEVQRSRLNNIGIQWPSQMSFSPIGSGTGARGLTVDDLRNLSGSTISVGVGATIANLRRDVTDIDVLANPRIRARNKEKAKIMIGEKLPIITSTSTATGLVSDNIQYLDVGLKVEVEPEVRLKNDVLIKLALEVSSVTNTVPTASGNVAYQLGTRNANTSLLLRDGETQILAGLISAQERSSGKRVPGLGDIPILGRLFGSQQDENAKTEIVLSITPRVIRGLKRPDIQQTEFWSGTESMLRTKPLLLESRDQERLGAKSVAPNVAPAPVGGSLLGDAKQPDVPAKNVQLAWQGPAKVKPGEDIRIALKIKTDGAVRSLPIQFSYDPKALQITDISEGAFFNQNGGATSFSKNVDATNGKAFVSIARSDTVGASGEGTALLISARPLTQADNIEIKVLQASAIAQSGSQPSLVLPPSWSASVGP